jgi:cytochrome c oxidase assembly protein subunit 15
VQPRAPGRGFRGLAYAAALLTFALIVVGGVVRISDSGLGCGLGGSGTKGWPLCGGRLVPLVDTHMIVEYSHRALAAAVTALIATLVYLAWTRYRSDRRLLRTTLAAFGLILFQAALGGLTVEKGLEEELVATHLGVAMLQIGLLIFLARLSSARAAVESRGVAPAGGAGATRSIRTLAICASVAVLATIVTGGYMSASELHGTGNEATAADPHTACGTDFPSCGGELMPFGRSRAVDIHLTHRAFMYLASALVIALFLTVLRQRRRLAPEAAGSLTGAAGATLAILAVQVALGALNVWLGEHPWLVVVHLTVGALLWVSLVIFSLMVLGAQQPAEASARHKARIQAAPAGGSI